MGLVCLSSILLMQLLQPMVWSLQNDAYSAFFEEDNLFAPYPHSYQKFAQSSEFEESHNLLSSNYKPDLKSNPGCGTPPKRCPKTKYRSYDGSCNNLRNPVLGTPNTPYTRLLPPNYGDGISLPTLARSGKELPSARKISLTLYPDVLIEDQVWTLNAMQYGQFISHDMSMIALPKQIKCCSSDGQVLSNVSEHCYPIVLPEDDPSHSQTSTRCMNFVRTITDRDRNCVCGSQPAEQLTAVNHYLDFSIVYGNTVQQNRQLRDHEDGRMRTEHRGGQDWPPRPLNADGICTMKKKKDACYLAGDVRVNQNPQLTALHILYLREHNRIADTLAKLNPHCNDEIIFQESRRINIAQHQHITFYEWLPIFIGFKNALKNNIIYQTSDFVNDYDESVNPTVLNEHATAASRYFHSSIAGNLNLVTEDRSSYGSLNLSDWFNQPQILEEGNNFDYLCRGLNTQPQFRADIYHVSAITEHLFGVGLDLKSFDVQRNRDHGLASYNDYRQFCGLPKANTFNDFKDVMNIMNVQKLSTLYECPDDVDLTVGGSLEDHVPGTLSGPTFLCIITEQFFRTRVGDRFFYENGGQNGFTLRQLNEIRKASISRLICDNGHSVKAMQPEGFKRISPSNAVVPCDNLPVVNLSLWKNIKACYR